jgi:hypothetical protein
MTLGAALVRGTSRERERLLTVAKRYREQAKALQDAANRKAGQNLSAHRPL